MGRNKFTKERLKESTIVVDGTIQGVWNSFLEISLTVAICVAHRSLGLSEEVERRRKGRILLQIASLLFFTPQGSKRLHEHHARSIRGKRNVMKIVRIENVFCTTIEFQFAC